MLCMTPLFANATITIGDFNIGNYANTGIVAKDDNVEIKTTSATAPHIDMNNRVLRLVLKMARC